jgi:LuxR family transcriptional regulator, quorum-sensing system regulator BjaR1
MSNSHNRYCFEDFVTATSAASTSQELFDALVKAIAEYGYEKIIFSVFNDPDLPVLSQQHGIYLRDLENWIGYYAQYNYAQIDPITNLVRAGATIFQWKDVEKLTRLSRAQERFMHDLPDLDLYHGVAVPLGHGTSAIGLSTGNKNELPDANLAMLNAICTQAYLTFKRLYGVMPKSLRAESNLTRAESEVLTWAAVGKTDVEIGMILGISRKTVDAHLRSTFRKLDANNRVTAVLKGIQQGFVRL